MIHQNNPVNKKISVANFFNNIPTFVALDGTPHLCDTVSEAIDVSTSVTHINTTAGAHAGSITDGVNGQIKIITMIVKGGSNNSVVTLPILQVVLQLLLMLLVTLQLVSLQIVVG